MSTPLKEITNLVTQLTEQRVQTLQKQMEHTKALLAEQEKEWADLTGGSVIASTGLPTVGTTKVSSKQAERSTERPTASQQGSLESRIIQVLKKAGKALTVAQIEHAVVASGYVTASKNFVSVIRQAIQKSEHIVRDSEDKGYVFKG